MPRWAGKAENENNSDRNSIGELIQRVDSDEDLELNLDHKMKRRGGVGAHDALTNAKVKRR